MNVVRTSYNGIVIALTQHATVLRPSRINITLNNDVAPPARALSTMA